MPRHLSFFDSFRPLDALFVFVRAGDDQRRLLHNDRRGVQSVPLNGRARRAAGSAIQWYGLDTSSVIVEQAPLVIPSAHENEKRIQRAK